MTLNAKRLDDVLEAQKIQRVVHEARQTYFFEADVMLESAAFILSCPRLPLDLRTSVEQVQRLLGQANDEARRLEDAHQQVINSYARDTCGVSPGMVIRPVRKPKDRSVRISRISVEPDGGLTASGWRLGSGSRSRETRWDSVRLTEGQWSVVSDDASAAVAPHEQAVRQRHNKSWGILVDSTEMASDDRADAAKVQLRAITEIGRALAELTRVMRRFTTGEMLEVEGIRDSEVATLDDVLTELEPFPVLIQTLKKLNALADVIENDSAWADELERETQLIRFDLLAARYGIRAGDKLAVRYPKSASPDVWCTLAVARVWDSSDGKREGEMIVGGNRLLKDGTPGKRDEVASLVPYETEWRLLDPIRDAESRHSRYGDAKWYPPPPIFDYDTPEDVLHRAGEYFIEFLRALLFDRGGVCTDGISITVHVTPDESLWWTRDWAGWKRIDGPDVELGKGVEVTASHLGYAVGDPKEQAAAFLAAGLHEIAKSGHAYWCWEAVQRARGMILAVGAVYEHLRNPYHTSTNTMMPESRAYAVYIERKCEALGRRFTDEDLIRWVAGDVAETLRRYSPVFYIDARMKHGETEDGGRGRLVGRTSL